jgi:hypothetical protein
LAEGTLLAAAFAAAMLLEEMLLQGILLEGMQRKIPSKWQHSPSSQ